MKSLALQVVFVGLDYHQDSVQVCVMDATGKVLLNKKFANSWGEIVNAVRRYGGQVQAAIEACTGAANLARELAEKAGWSISLAHPGYVSRMKQNPDKSDYSDARMLADLVRVGYLPKVWLAPDRIVELRDLVRYRQQLANARRSVKLRIRALLRNHRLILEDVGNPWTKPWLALLRDYSKLPANSRWVMNQLLDQLEDLIRHIGEAEKRLAAELADDAVFLKLCEQPGIALVTAATMRAEIAQFERFQTGKQLARFCGLSPRNASSGAKQADAGLIKAGNKGLRAVLIEAGHRLLRLDDRWGALGAKLSAKGKPKSVVVAAVTNRWIRWLFHQMQPENLATAA
jgi:transposase